MFTEENSHLEENHPIRKWTSSGTFPALQLEWIAVQKQIQGKGLGTILIGKVIDVFLNAIERTAVPALICRALNQEVAAFYEKLGFVRYGTQEDTSPRMLLGALAVLELKALREAQSDSAL